MSKAATRRRLSGPAAGLIGLVLGVALVGGGYAWASIPDSSGTIQGCYTNKSPHVLRVIDTAKATQCPSGTTALSWNQQGPAGTPGLTNTGWHRATIGIPGNQATATADINCPTGQLVVAAGFERWTQGSAVQTASYPWSDGTWHMTFDTTGNPDGGVGTVTLLCADGSVAQG
jgi:hypothetical protein